MIRKNILALAFSLIALIAGAQTDSGQWRIHPNFVGDLSNNCYDTGSKVYFLSNGSLYYYDKESQAVQAMDMNGSINGTKVSQIYYNFAKNYLVVVYNDCNIDFIEDNGNVTNISAIKEVVLPKTKVINDVTFGNNKAYISASFGYIVVEDGSFDVVEVRNYEIAVQSVAAVGDIKVMSVLSQFYYCPVDEQIDLIRWHQKEENSAGPGKIYPINENKFFFSTLSSFYVVTVAKRSDGTRSFTRQKIATSQPKSIQPTPTGFVASRFYNTSGDVESFNDFYYTFDQQGGNATQHEGSELYSIRDDNNWWMLGANGLVNVVNGVQGNYITPNAISITRRPFWATFDPYHNRMLLYRSNETRITSWETCNTEINSWDGNVWRNITPPNVGATELDYGSNYEIKLSPNEPNTYFYFSRKFAGVAKVKDDSIVTRYHKDNAPISERAGRLAFDSKGNLWMVMPYPDSSPDAVVLTPEKQMQDSAQASDFIVNNLGRVCKNNNKGFKRASFDIGAGDVKVYAGGEYNTPLIVWENNDDLSLKRYKTLTDFIDQDRAAFSTWGWVYIKADNEGKIWIGTVVGLISFDPQKIFDEDVVRINRIKATDEQGFKVFEGIQVNCIECDAQNRKWVATNSAGVYLLNADGTEILKHFDTSNSLLPANQVYSIGCNRATGSVMMVTPNGVAEYLPEASSSMTDYSKAYAYPNPVQESFTGYVTIANLMDNSSVVIVDATGTKVASLTSTGSIAKWDGCNYAGTPVPTGMYRVYAAQGSTPATTGKPVTKIAVIR